MASLGSGIHEFSYRKTNYFAVEGDGGTLLAFDAGWPCTWSEYARAFKQTGLKLEALKFAVVSHFHLDHAGLFGEMLARGIACVVFENQMDTIAEMEALILRKEKEYQKVSPERLLSKNLADSRLWLRNLGIFGELIATPGHSGDSVTFISDGGVALIGDLPAKSQAMPDDAATLDSWVRIRRLKAKQAYPAHGNPFAI